MVNAVLVLVVDYVPYGAQLAARIVTLAVPLIEAIDLVREHSDCVAQENATHHGAPQHGVIPARAK